uniref:Uncharacterized protein n=1 Tax=Ditylenchus dipsaci TaxID=166011 RepID=A0A915D1J8_9BILA
MAMSRWLLATMFFFAKLSIIDEEEELSIGGGSSCCTAEASISLASIFSEMDKLTVRLVTGKVSLEDVDQTALSNLDYLSSESMSPKRLIVFEDNGVPNLGIGAIELNNCIPSQYDYYQCQLPQTYESMLHLCRSQKNIPSFYQLPELNTKPVDYAPRLDFVSSQYELMEMHEYAAHNLPMMACKLKAELLFSITAVGERQCFQR